MKPPHSNVRKLYLLNLLCGIVFWYPIEKLYLQSIGADAFGVSISATVYLATLILFDVPSGVLADRWRRKYTLLLGVLCLVVCCLIGGFSRSLVQYLPLSLMLGGFMVLTSGTFQAMMYDSLRDSGHEKRYDVYQGRAHALFLAGIGVSSLAGGYLAQWFGMRATYFVSAAVVSLAIWVCLLLAEPRSHHAVSDRRLGEHVRISTRRIVASRLLMQLALLLAALYILRGLHNEYTGLLFIALGMTAIQMGYGAAGKWLASALGQVVAPRIGRRALRLVPLFFLSFLAFSLVRSAWTLIFFYLATITYSVFANQAEAAVQEVTPSEVRATTLSLLSFAGNLVLVPLGLAFGWTAERSDVFNAYLIAALAGLAYLAVWLIVGRQMFRRLGVSE